MIDYILNKEKEEAICAVRIQDFVEYLNEYVWTYVSCTPEILTDSEDINNWEPQKGWNSLFYKNIDENTRQIAIKSNEIEEKFSSADIKSDTSLNVLLSFIKDVYGMELTENDYITVDFYNVDHDIFNVVAALNI